MCYTFVKRMRREHVALGIDLDPSACFALLRHGSRPDAQQLRKISRVSLEELIDRAVRILDPAQQRAQITGQRSRSNGIEVVMKSIIPEI